MNPNSEKDLEQIIHRTLRSLPERRAPRTLEHRVLAAIAARKALPWWHQSFSSWPSAVKLAFLGAAAGIVAALTLVDPSSAGPVNTFIQNANAIIRPLRTAANAVESSGQTLAQGIPSLWITGAVAFVGFLYAALFGIGTAAYKTLISNR